MYNCGVENECITVTIDRIAFQNEQNGYYILKASSREYPAGITVVGSFGVIQPGEEVRVHGTWACHPQFGMQFQALSHTVLKPATLVGIEKYLGSGMIKGIGPVTAKKLVSNFGLETLEVIEKNPERLAECDGIGPHKIEKIVGGWFLQRAIQDVMIFLQGHGISPAYASRIYKKFQKDSMSKVSANPYILATEIPGIGFKKADKIAQEFGITDADPRRLKAGILYVLDNLTKDGHLFLTLDDLQIKAAEILQLDSQSDIETFVNELAAENRLIIVNWEDDRLVYLPSSYRAEHNSVELLESFLAERPQIAREKLLEVLEEVFKKHGLRLTPIQELAVEKSLRKGLLVITGGPGTGKTTTLKAVVAAHKALKRKVLLASPTGRAAKRLAEVSGYEAMTIHRLLEYSPQEHGFKKNGSDPLDCDTLIIDESSMIDMQLFYSLIKAVPGHAAFILVGDSDQLPSVGAGLVLRNLILSEVVPVVKLETVFRQAESSDIIKNAHLINSGKMPELLVPDGKKKTDCYFLHADENEKVISLLKNVVNKSLPARFKYDPMKDIQVLSPMNRGPLGAGNLNVVLQEALNPAAPDKNELSHLNRVFRTGDKVIQLRNNYDLEVFNGDIGFIKEANDEDQELIVEFSQGEVIYQSSDLLDLSLAYAITVHKSQGSEYPAVVMLIATQHYMLLQRNLLYTGLTRARKHMVIVGTKRAVGMAVTNNRVKKRNTIFRLLIAKKYGC